MEEYIAIDRLKQGDLNGLEVLVEHYGVRAVHVAQLILRDRLQAEDTAQTAFLRAAERIYQFDDRYPFSGWFFRIVINEALRTANQQKRWIGLEEEPDLDAGVWERVLIDPDPGVEALIEHKDARNTIRKALARLSPEQRAVVVMRYYLEWSEAEISVQFQRPTSTIKWWLRAARNNLRRLLGATGVVEEYGEEK